MEISVKFWLLLYYQKSEGLSLMCSYILFPVSSRGPGNNTVLSRTSLVFWSFHLWRYEHLGETASCCFPSVPSDGWVVLCTAVVCSLALVLQGQLWPPSVSKGQILGEESLYRWCKRLFYDRRHLALCLSPPQGQMGVLSGALDTLHMTSGTSELAVCLRLLSIHAGKILIIRKLCSQQLFSPWCETSGYTLSPSETVDVTASQLLPQVRHLQHHLNSCSSNY